VDDRGGLGADLIKEAVLIWTGWTHTPNPVRDDAALIDRYGEDLALELLPVLRRLMSEFYESDAYNRISGLHEMGEEAARQFRVLHPELPDEVADAFAWCYKRDWR